MGNWRVGLSLFEPFGLNLCFYNAAMILAVMEFVAVLESDAAKLFASFYALFSGITFLSATSVLFTPFVHRLLHALNADPDDNPDS